MSWHSKYVFRPESYIWFKKVSHFVIKSSMSLVTCICGIWKKFCFLKISSRWVAVWKCTLPESISYECYMCLLSVQSIRKKWQLLANKGDQFHKMSLNSQRIVIDSCAATLNGENNCFFYSTYSTATNTSSVVRCLTRFPWKRKPWTLSSPEHPWRGEIFTV